jgi:NADH:ubiquinone oxidoreductase subunit 5 (subunit L)/multisubunit Na+/H+ antiporter MnhA subunit
MTYMTGMVQRVFLGVPRSPALAAAPPAEVPLTMRAGMGLLAAGILALGLAPQALDALLRLASGGR